MDESSKPLKRCPVCRYDLRGLPTEHRCPECGLGIDGSMKIWRMGKPSRFIWAVGVGNNLVLSYALIDYLGGRGAAFFFEVMPLVLCVEAVLVGKSWVRRRARAVLSRTSYATRGRFSFGFELFQLADLDVVSREPLAIKVAADIRSEADRRNIPLPTKWMTLQQGAEFRREFVDRWRECRDENNSATALPPETSPP